MDTVTKVLVETIGNTGYVVKVNVLIHRPTTHAHRQENQTCQLDETLALIVTVR